MGLKVIGRIRFVRELFLRALRQFQKNNGLQTAAAVAFYTLFSLFPLLIFLAGVAGLFLGGERAQREIVDAVLRTVPLDQQEGRRTVTNAVQSITSPENAWLGLLGLLGMAWSATAMFSVVRQALNRAYRVEVQRPYFQQKLVDLALVLGFGLFFAVSMGATAFLRIARARSEDLAALGDVAQGGGPLWDAASYAVPLVFSFVAFALLYSLVPAQHKRLADVWPGAAAAAVVFEATKLAFSVYLEHFSRYDLIFGSLGAAASFLFWVYLAAAIMLFGAEIASEYPRLRGAELPPAAPGPPLREALWRWLRSLFLRST